MMPVVIILTLQGESYFLFTLEEKTISVYDYNLKF